MFSAENTQKRRSGGMACTMPPTGRTITFDYAPVFVDAGGFPCWPVGVLFNLLDRVKATTVNIRRRPPASPGDQDQDRKR